MLTNCFRFAPRDSVPGLIAKICKYLKDHPGWSEEELEEQIKQFIGQTGVESFNGRTGAVVLNENDVNNLKIASAYFAEGDETINELDLLDLYNHGVRFVFTNWNGVTSGYDLAFVLEYFSSSNDVVYYPMASGSSGGGNIVSVNGKTGIVELSLSDILGDSGAQVKLCTATEFTSTTLTTWNAYYEEGYRVVGVVNSDASAIDYIYLLKQDENNHQPIGLSSGASDAYTPTNPPPYPVTSVNGETGAVTGLYSAKTPPPYPVTSVNSKTGEVNLTAADVGAVPATGGVFTGGITVKNIHVNQDSVPAYPALRFMFNNETIFSLAVDILENSERYRFIEFARDGSGNFESYDFPTIDKDLTTKKYYTIFTTKNPPPYPVTSVNGLTGGVTGIRYEGIVENGKTYNFNGTTLIAIPYISAATLPPGSTQVIPIAVSNIGSIIPISVASDNSYSLQLTLNKNYNGLNICVTNNTGEGENVSMQRNYFILFQYVGEAAFTW